MVQVEAVDVAGYAGHRTAKRKGRPEGPAYPTGRTRRGETNIRVVTTRLTVNERRYVFRVGLGCRAATRRQNKSPGARSAPVENARPVENTGNRRRTAKSFRWIRRQSSSGRPMTIRCCHIA